MARQEYRDFSEMDFDDAPAPPQRKKSLESTPVAQQAAPAAQGNFFDTLDWNDGKFD